MFNRFCRECGKKISENFTIITMESNLSAIEYFGFKEKQNQYVCKECWNKYENSTKKEEHE